MRCTLCLALLLSLGTGIASGQRVPLVRLGPPDATLLEEFTSVGSVRELRDRRLLVSDSRDVRIVVVDFSSGTATQIGRKGSGPQEYMMAGTLHSIGADSTLMADVTSRRWLLLDGSQVVSTLPPDAPAIVATNSYVLSTDARGFVLTTRRPPRRVGVTKLTKADSAAIVLVERTTGRADTVAFIRLPDTQIRTATDSKGNVTSMSVRVSTLAVGEEAILYSDGTLAVARLEPYRVDWRLPDGRWLRGDALPVPAVRMSAREKQAYLRRIASEAGKPASSPDSITDWPDMVPPFQAGPLLRTADGKLLIRRTKTADFSDTRYDIVNRHGVLEQQLVLPASDQVIGFGVLAAYVISTNDDGVQQIRRHPWPAQRARP